MPSARNRLDACSASEVAWLDVIDKSLINDNREKVEKRSETSVMCTKSAKVCHIVSDVPGDRRGLVSCTDF